MKYLPCDVARNNVNLQGVVSGVDHSPAGVNLCIDTALETVRADRGSPSGMDGQPNLNMPNPYTSSHCDRSQSGWNKWAHDYPDMYSRTTITTVPDWYNRQVNSIRSGDLKELYWSWERPSKATERNAYGLEARRSTASVQRGYTATPHDIVGQIPNVRWGLYHPHFYQDPTRAESLPPLHVNEKRL